MGIHWSRQAVNDLLFNPISISYPSYMRFFNAGCLATDIKNIYADMQYSYRYFYCITANAYGIRHNS